MQLKFNNMLSTKDYNNKSKRMEELLSKLTQAGTLTKIQQRELDAISDEIAEYEEEKYPFKAESLLEMIELRMYQRKLKQKDLAQMLGTSSSRISEILSGKKTLTFELAKSLHNRLNIDADLILADNK
jgi:HTH-type transcriptional regulator / antitoxin HigA